MKWQTIGTAALISILSASIGYAQCNRGGQSTSPSAGNLSSQFTQSTLTSPYNFAALQSQQQAQLQQRMLAQQLMYRQALAQRQRRNANQLARQRSSSSEQLASSSSRTARQARLRQQNAEKAFALAAKAETNGNTKSAEKYYRRAIRIAGGESSIAEQAEDAIAALSQGNNSNGLASTLTALASIEP